MAKANVNAPRQEYTEALSKWTRCRDTSAGSDAVKARAELYLPRLDSHKKQSIVGNERYNEYKLRALFYNATGRTVEGLAGAIFQKAPVVTMPARAKGLEKDISASDLTLEQFALVLMKEFLITGRYGILMDPDLEAPATDPPYWVGYKAEDIINWKYDTTKGDATLTMVVLSELVEASSDDNEFCVDMNQQYRVLRLRDGVYTSQVYTKDLENKGQFIAGEEKQPERRGQPLSFIPFIMPPLLMTPPILDLAEVNLSHYRGSADLKHGLHFTALPTPWVSGAFSGPNTEPLSIGAGVAWELEKEGRAGMLEFSGAGLKAIRDDMQDMQHMMASLGARLLEQQEARSETATAVEMRHSGDHASLRTLAQQAEGQLTWALKVTIWWTGTEATPDDIDANLELNKDFINVKATADEVRAALLMLQAESISFETFYAMLQAGGWSRPGVDAEQELKDIETYKELIAPEPVEPDPLLVDDQNPPAPEPKPAVPGQKPPVPPVVPKKGAAQ